MDICGIDEAGRGPVLGPLVICGVVIDKKDEGKLKKMGVKDSKLLTPKKRDALYEKILETVKKYQITILSPNDIDLALFDPLTNLNWLEADSACNIINMLTPEKAIIDCPSPNTAEYKEYIRKKLNCDCELLAEHKADLNYVVVGAASILAKVTRDREIDKIKAEIGKDVGSGYCADPVTQKFLEEHYKEHAEIFRKSWQTYKDVVAKKQQKLLGEFLVAPRIRN